MGVVWYSNKYSTRLNHVGPLPPPVFASSTKPSHLQSPQKEQANAVEHEQSTTAVALTSTVFKAAVRPQRENGNYK